MNSSMNITVIDTTAYITLLYKPSYRVISAVSSFKKLAFNHVILSNLASRDTLETWNAKFTSDTTLLLHVNNSFVDTNYLFTVNYDSSVHVQVTHFDTTITDSATKQPLLIVSLNSLQIKNHSFKFLFTQTRLRTLFDSIYKHVKPDFKYYSPKSKNYFFPYYYNLLTSVLYNDNGLLVISANWYEYLGGAHGMNWVNYYNIDVKTGKILKLSDVLTNTDGIKDQIYNKLVEEKIPLFGGKSSIYIPQSFYVEGSTIYFVYPLYAIAPYYVGIISVPFDFKELKDKLSPDFLAKYYPNIKL